MSMEKIFIHAEDLLRDSLELGMRVVRSGFRPTFLVGIWRGGAPIGITVQEVLEFHGLECDHLAIRTSSYTGIDQRAKTVRVHAIDYLVSRLTAEDRLLLIDDVFDTGLSLEAVIGELNRRCRQEYARAGAHRHHVLQARRATAARWCPTSMCGPRTSGSSSLTRCTGCTREEILAHKPVDASFFDAVARIVYKVGASCVQAGALRRAQLHSDRATARNTRAASNRATPRLAIRSDSLKSARKLVFCAHPRHASRILRRA